MLLTRVHSTSILHDKTIDPSYLTGLKHVSQIINIESLPQNKRLHAVIDFS